MGFEAPMMLWGLLLGGLPIVIHLLERRRARRLPFAAVEFLFLGDAKRRRRLKISQWLVLALRVALLLALTLALSKPSWTHDEGDQVSSAEPSAVVLILDDTASMGAMDAEGRRRFDAMIDAALERVSSGGALARFGLVTLGRPSRVITQGMIHDQAALQAHLRRLKLGAGQADVHQALWAAQALLGGAVHETRVLWVGSDRAKEDWGTALSLGGALGQRTQVELLELVELGPEGNVSVDKVEVRGRLGPQGESLLEVTLHNHGQETRRGEVRVRLGESVVATSVEIAPETSAVAVLAMKLPADRSTRTGVARWMGSDVLQIDDERFFTLDPARALRVAVVNGSPRSVPWLDEVFFVRAGLSARGSEGEAWIAEHLQVGELSEGVLAHTDVVILANVGALSARQGLALRSFVEEGGGLFIAVGDHMSAASNATYGSLLALPIARMRQLGAGGAPGEGLEVALPTHPILRPFAGAEAETLTRSTRRMNALLVAHDRPGLQILLRWRGGDPALLEAPMGQGRVALWTSSLDRDGTDLVLRTSFVPLLQRTVAFLAGREGQESEHRPTIGVPVLLKPPGEAGELVLTGPQGLERDIVRRERCADSPERCDLGLLELPGFYQLSLKGQPWVRRVFSLNVAGAESALGFLSREDLLRRLRGGAAPQGEREAPEIGVSTGAPLPAGEPLWPLALVALLGLLLAEAWFVLR